MKNELAETRRARGLSQVALSRITMIDVGAISRFEHGGPIGQKRAARIARAMGVEVASIWPTLDQKAGK
ncbi:MAG: helix-turn-helix transcriptional regulator [Kiritimatiellaeota bacterium]|nr:helix-turn-helix transcriptional regulator [Kiritimatiellota bacterium]